MGRGGGGGRGRKQFVLFPAWIFDISSSRRQEKETNCSWIKSIFFSKQLVVAASTKMSKMSDLMMPRQIRLSNTSRIFNIPRSLCWSSFRKILHFRSTSEQNKKELKKRGKNSCSVFAPDNKISFVFLGRLLCCFLMVNLSHSHKFVLLLLLLLLLLLPQQPTLLLIFSLILFIFSPLSSGFFFSPPIKIVEVFVGANL